MVPGDERNIWSVTHVTEGEIQIEDLHMSIEVKMEVPSKRRGGLNSEHSSSSIYIVNLCESL